MAQTSRAFDKIQEIQRRKLMGTAGTVPKVETAPTVAPVPKVGAVPGFRARIAQDGHTVWEQQIYEALWKEARGGMESRDIAIGYRHIASLTGKGINTVQRNMRSLTEKLAIEPIGRHDSDTRTPKTYRVYSYSAILRRRAAAGLEWVTRNRQGVSLGTVPTLAAVPTVDTVPGMGTGAIPTVGIENSPHGGDTFREETKEEGKPCRRCGGTGWEIWEGKRRKCGLH